MKNEDNDIDKLFRRKLADPVDETGYREDDWDALEQLMDKGKKRRGIVLWLPIISSVAAMLLLMLGWWLFKPQVSNDKEKIKQQIAVIKQPTKQEQVTNNTPAGKENTITNQQAANVPAAHQPAAIRTDDHINGLPKTGTTNQANTVIAANNYIPVGLSSNNQPESRNTIELVAINTGVNIDAEVANRQYINTATVAQKEIANNGYVKMIAAKRNAIVTQSSFKHPQFALTVMGAPEINGVNSFQQSKSGSNVGLLFSIGVNKLTISTGANYSAKPYNTSFDNYHSTGTYTFKTDPIDVVADCRVIDIPLNVDYQLYNKHQNKFSVGTGISSYLMMHESYTYDYADPSIKGPRNYSVASPGNYLFGVLNLQATYQRQVNSKVGVSVQPYLKLPLTSIGASQVKLQSAGVAIGLSWNINSLTKP